MKSSFVKKIICTAVIATLFAIPVNAAEGVMRNGTVIGGENNIFTIEEADSSDTVYGGERGTIISTGTVAIRNEGGGKVGITIETLAHVQCSKITHEAVLERKNDSGSWEEVARYKFTALQEDYPNEKLTGLTNAFTVKNQTIGKYYRVRGIHAVVANGNSETYSTKTNGILITQYGD